MVFPEINMNLIYNNVMLKTNVRHGKSMHQKASHSGIWLWGASPCVARLPAFIIPVLTFLRNGCVLCRSLACGSLIDAFLNERLLNHSCSLADILLRCLLNINWIHNKLIPYHYVLEKHDSCFEVVVCYVGTLIVVVLLIPSWMKAYQILSCRYFIEVFVLH